jgi:NAD(P)-dependent dehydrogenase (short-subunit alcohol dehydrogenase family)
MSRRPEHTGKLAGRNVLLTGATGTLGRTIAERYAAEGAALLLVARKPEPLEAFTDTLRSSGARASAFACDLSKADAIDALVGEAERRLGHVDILINAAAILGPIGAAADATWEQWMSTFSVNMIAAATLCARCVALMQPDGYRAKIINISGGGSTSARPRFTPYAAAKTALVRFSETLAAEARERGIDVNCIAPGIMSSGLTRAVVDAGPVTSGAAEYNAALKVVTSGVDSRLQAAELAVFLGSSASDGITGRLFSAVWDDWQNMRPDSPAFSSPEIFTLRRVVPPAIPASDYAR